MDLSVIFWLKNSKSSNNIPKDLLVANALAATEEVTDIFMEGVIRKIQRFEEEGSFDEENAGLILENIFCRRELMNDCDGDSENLTVEKLKSVQEKYEETIINAAGINNKALQKELAIARDEISKAEKEKSTIVENLKNKSRDKAKKISAFAYYTVKFGIFLIFVGLFAFGIVACILDGIEGDISIWGVVSLFFAILGIVDFWLEKYNLIKRIASLIKHRIYDYVLYREMSAISKIISGTKQD